jgi:hypothetical protein
MRERERERDRERERERVYIVKSILSLALLCVVMEIESRALHMLGKRSTTKLHLSAL